MMKTITILLFSIVLNGCGSTKQANTSANMKQTTNEIPNGSFYISKIGENVTLSETLKLNFDNSTKKISGFSGCNTFSGNYKIDKNKISFTDLISTKKACSDDLNMIESSIHNFLKETNKFKLNNNQITFLKGKKELFSVKQSDTETTTKTTQSSGMTFEYTAFTRGTYKNVKVNERVISSQFSRSEKAATKTCGKSDWDELMTLCKGLRASSLTKLEAPSKAHQYDGAAHATLTITDGENSYTTPTFDDGNPPKEIVAIVNKILKIGNSPKKKTEN